MSRLPRPSLPFLAALAALLVASLLPNAAVAATATTSVVGGERAESGSFPYLAFVYFRDGGETDACTGTVVSGNLVLTAAHCVLDEATGAPLPPTAFRVVTGEVDREAGDRVVSAVAAVAVDPEYAPRGERANWADAAVLQLSHAIAAPPVRLASAAEAPAPGAAALIAGWGKLGPEQAGPARSLRYATTTIQPADFCAGQAAQFDPAGQLCVLDAPSDTHSACSGDSGGPLLVAGAGGEPLEVGIASFSASQDCAPGSPQYYTRADLVAPWVAAEVAALAPTAASATAPKLPRLGARRARALARAALSQAFGRSFKRGSGYVSRCEALEPSKWACAVSWRRGGFRFAGWVTIFYALEGRNVVWRYTTRVSRTRG